MRVRRRRSGKNSIVKVVMVMLLSPFGDLHLALETIEYKPYQNILLPMRYFAVAAVLVSTYGLPSPSK